MLAELIAGEGGRLAARSADEGALACRARRARRARGSRRATSRSRSPARRRASTRRVAAVRAALARVAPAGVTPDEVSRAGPAGSSARAPPPCGRAWRLPTRWSVTKAGACPCSRTAAPRPRSPASPRPTSRAPPRRVLDPKRELIAVVHPPSAAPALARTSSAKPGRAEAGR